MKRLLVIASLLLVGLLMLPSQILAQSADNSNDFETSLQTTYDVQENGTTTVTQTFSIKNLQPTTYLKEYSLSTSFPQLQNIAANSNNKPITPDVTNDHSKTKIVLSFPDQVVGQGKVRTFQIKYDIPNMAVVAGQVMEVQIPPVTSQIPYKSHIVTLKTPLKFGRAVRVKPNPTATDVDLPNGRLTTTFDQTNPQAISAFYGDKQFYTMTLRYNLENNTTSTGLAQIALPPDTSFQKVSYESLDPPTNDLKRDEDGNWLATYQLPANTTQTVYLQTRVMVTLDPNNSVPVTQPASFNTEDKKYWETGNGEIKKIIDGKGTVKELYDYVVDTLHYSYDEVEKNSINHRLGAVEALHSPTQAVCQEFTDLFITLARAKGVPARRLTGYAYTQNSSLRPLSLESDILHAWPEYFNYDKNVWQPVDPTWESTTGGVDYFDQFDLNHVVFAINGKSSTTPYPAGSYKGTDLTTKDVVSEFATNFPTSTLNLDVQVHPVKMLGVNIPGKYILSITNKTGQAWYDVKVVFTNPNPNSLKLSKTEIYLPVVLPFQTVQQPFSVLASDWKPNTTVEIPYSFTALQQETTNDRKLSATSGPSAIEYANKTNFYIGLGICGAITAIGTGSLLVLGQRRKRPIRRQSQKPPQTS